MRVFKRLRAQFHQEWTWRLFCILQVAGVFGILVLDASQDDWSLVPEYRKTYALNDLGLRAQHEAWARCDEVRAEEVAHYKAALTAWNERRQQEQQELAERQRKWNALSQQERLKRYQQGDLGPPLIPPLDRSDPQPRLGPDDCKSEVRFFVGTKYTKTLHHVDWDLLEAWDLSGGRVYRYANWLLLLLLFGPFVAMKSLDWVLVAGRQPPQGTVSSGAGPRSERPLTPTETPLAREEARKREAPVQPAVSEEDVSTAIKEQILQCSGKLREKWVSFCERVPFRGDVPLSERIEAFAVPAAKFVDNEYPVLMAGDERLFWLMLFTAVLESGTHPKDEVNAATEELTAKLAREGGDA